MRVTIIPVDDTVLIDGRAVKLSLENHEALRGVHAVQWDSEKGTGTIERRGNCPLVISTLEAFQDICAAAEAKLSEPKPAPEPPDEIKRIDQIPADYVRALLRRDDAAARNLEAEYVALSGAAPSATKEGHR
jgi:hypothetical protein